MTNSSLAEHRNVLVGVALTDCVLVLVSVTDLYYHFYKTCDNILCRICWGCPIKKILGNAAFSGEMKFKYFLGLPIHVLCYSAKLP